MPPKQEALRSTVKQFFEKHQKRGKKFTVDHFRAKNVSRATIYRILTSLDTTPKPGKGRPKANISIPDEANCSQQEALRIRVRKFYEKHKHQGKKFTVDHFRAEDVPTSTIYRILASCRLIRKPGSGRPAVIMDKKGIKYLKKAFSDKDNISQSSAASKLNSSQQHVSKTLKKVGLRCLKKTRAPEYTEEQIANVKRQTRWMAKHYAGKSLILDDESYFPLSKTHVPGNDRFYTKDKASTPPSVKYKFKHKFEKKVMLYIAISERGVSKPWFKPSGLAINQDIYQNQCLKKILLPFIKKHHQDGNYVFWPDKASSHYAKKTVAFLENNEIPYVPKERNPTNLPQCRPIEDFFGQLSALVYKNNWRAENCKQLISRIKRCIEQMNLEAVKRSCTGIHKKLRQTAQNGPFSNIH